MINLVLCADEGYAKYGAVVMASAIKHSQCPERLRFFWLIQGVSEQTREGLHATVAGTGAQLELIEPNEEAFSDIELGRFGEASLLRLSMHRYLPSGCQRVIYLDCDLLVLGDVAELWSMPLKENTIGAAMDLCNRKMIHSRCSADHYFNSGVLLVDLDRWRDRRVLENALAYIEERSGQLKYPDQDALNYVLSEDWLRLPSAWNLQPTAYAAVEKNYAHLKSHLPELHEAIRSPRIVHFIGARKPWHPLCAHPLQELFVEHSCGTPWPIDATQLRGRVPFAKRIRFAMKTFKIQRRRKMTEL